MFCPKCNQMMKHMYSFSNDRNCEFDICKNCYFETKPKSLKFNHIEIMQDNRTDNGKVKNKVNKVKQSMKHKKKKGKK